MIVRKAYKYRLKNREKHAGLLARFSGCQRFVWNHFLARQKDRLEAKELCLSYADMCKELTTLKKIEETVFLSEVPSQALQQTLKDLSRALQDFFRRKRGFPKFKRKGVSDSFRYPQGIKLDGRATFLPKLGWIQLYHSQAVEGEVRCATVSRRGRHWFVSIQTEQERDKPTHPSTSSVGIDMGVVRFATLSTGEFFEPLNSFKRLERKLSREQKKLSRKSKYSNNWKKQKSRVQGIHVKIADARRDYLNKLSTHISKNHAIVGIEDLKVSEMSARERARPTCKSLRKGILDQGWYEFRRQLEYKQFWRGGQVVVVDPRDTSRTCPSCGHVSASNRKSQSRFECEECKFCENADLVAASNILKAVGHRAILLTKTYIQNLQ